MQVFRVRYGTAGPGGNDPSDPRHIRLRKTASL